MTAGIAAARPAAVVIRASEIPGATARSVAGPAGTKPGERAKMPPTGPDKPAKGGNPAVESVNDAPDGSEQPDKRSNRAGDREPRHIPFKAREFFRSGNLHSALKRSGILHDGAGADLPLVFLKAAFEHTHQRTGSELFG